MASENPEDVVGDSVSVNGVGEALVEAANGFADGVGSALGTLLRPAAGLSLKFREALDFDHVSTTELACSFPVEQ